MTCAHQDDVDQDFAAEFRGGADGSQNLVTPASISFENIGLRLKAKNKTTILNGVSGVVPPQSLVALMGPSGCGKTTFMVRAAWGVRVGSDLTLALARI